MNTLIRLAACWAILLSSAAGLLAGGSGLNVVVVNQNSPASVELGNYYCEKRQVPPQNFLCIGWTGGKVEWTKADFESILRAPLKSMLASPAA